MADSTMGRDLSKRLLLLSGIISLVLLHFSTHLPYQINLFDEETLALLTLDQYSHEESATGSSDDSNHVNMIRNVKSNHGRLEFVHITKTGGSAIERAGSMANITWGICHFEAAEECLSYTKTMLFRPPKLKRGRSQQYGELEPWHTPHFWLKRNNVYSNADTFVVVRNPYDRVISEFYCKYFGHNRQQSFLSKRWNRLMVFHRDPQGSRTEIRKDSAPQKRNVPMDNARRKLWERERETRHNIRDSLFRERKTSNSREAPRQNKRAPRGGWAESPTSLNRWIQSKLQGDPPSSAHLLPQNLYVYDDNATQVVTHVLRYETLHDDFAQLMKLYDLPVVLPDAEEEYVNAGAASAKNRLTVEDLTRETIDVINWYYADDFRLLGYKMMGA